MKYFVADENNGRLLVMPHVYKERIKLCFNVINVHNDLLLMFLTLQLIAGVWKY